MYKAKSERVEQGGRVLLMGVPAEAGGEAPAKWDHSGVVEKWAGVKIDIVVAVHDDPAYAKMCLEAVRDRTPEGLDWTLTVVDNASDAFTGRLLASMDWVHKRIRVKRHGGYLPALWAAARETSGDWLVFLSQRTVVGDGWLEGLLWAAQQDERVGMVAPWTDARLPPPSGSNYLDVSERLSLAKPAYAPDALAPTRACVMVRRKAFDECGGLDVPYYAPGYGEFADLWMRLINRKWRVVRATRSLVLDRTADGMRGQDEHRRFLVRWGDNAVKAMRSRAGKDKVEEAASVILSTGTDRPEVAFLFKDLELCGAVLAATHVCNGLVERGWNAYIAYSRVTPGHTLRHVPARFTPVRLPDGDGMIRGLTNKMGRGWVVASTWLAVDDCARIADSRKDVSALYYVQDDERKFRRPSGKLHVAPSVVEAAWSRLPNLVANSEWVRDMLRAAGHDPHRIGIGVDPLEFRPLPRPVDRVRVMAHCRPSTPRRGWPFIVKALNRVARSREFEFVAFDQDYDPDELALPWHGNIGRVSPSELARHIGMSHIFFEGSEVQGWGMQALEAMSCGCALVCTDSKGVRDFATDGHDCFMVEHGDVDGAAAAICQLVDEADTRKVLGGNARKSAEAFDWSGVVDAWDRYLREGL